ncbi:MAG: endonuclease III domain-containing protein [Spirochaetaceae bacterium]
MAFSKHLFDEIAAHVGTGIPSVSQIAREHRDPFRVLVSTIISLRTKDEVTMAATERLFGEASTPKAMASLPPERIGRLIYPAGFYRTKGRNIAEVCRLLLADHDGRVPPDPGALLALPGVGRKTANLVLGLGFGIPAICVDTHVHRIANRLGWIATKNPEETEYALMDSVPKELWIPLNETLVRFGQGTCTPTSPWCSRCPVAAACPRIGVSRSR